MSKTLLTIGVALLFSMSCIPQSKAQIKARGMKTATISGATFDEKNFVNDADLKLWTVTNPRLLKGLAAQYVTLTGPVDDRDRTITVESVRLILPKQAKLRSADYKPTTPRRPIPDYVVPRPNVN
jgi:hypothetical protein